MPEVSVIVPAHDAAGTLAATLSALAGQEGGVDHEVVVVDDGSSDATAQIAEQMGARLVVHERPLGAAEARNAGVRATSGRLLAFTDADCAPAPDWLAHGVTAAAAGADLVQGAVVPDPAADRTPFDRTVEVGAETGLYETANLFVDRDWFERLGGFESSRGLGPERPHGEDTIFGWRLRRAGGRTRFAPEARVFHAVFARDAAGFVAERWRLRWFPELVGEVPELRELMFMHVFQTRRRAAFDLALAAAVTALATRRLAPLAGTLPYALAHLPVARAPSRGALRESAVHVAADAVGAAALALGSARSGRLVL